MPSVPQAVLAAADGRRLNLILLPTEKCNFRCTYCYEDFSVGRMTSRVVAGVKALIRSREEDLHELEIGWFGGEPLLAQDVIMDVSTAAQEAARHNSQLSYTASMTTNGYFLDIDTCTRLCALGVSTYQISLDGWGEGHDATRRSATGAGTFERIWQNLLAIRDSVLPVQILLRVHYTLASSPHLSALIHEINLAFANDPRFSVYFKSVDRLGGENDAQIHPLGEAEKRAIEHTLERQLTNPMQIYRLPDAEGVYVCYASSANSFVIRANGDVAKCTVALYDERNRIGLLNEDGTIALDAARLSPWLRGLETLDPTDLACPWAQMG